MSTELIIFDVVVASIAVKRGASFWSNGAQFQSNCVLGLLKMFNSVVVSARSIPEFPTTAQLATRHTQPEVRFQVAISAMSHRLCSNDFCLICGQTFHMSTRFEINFPFLDCTRIKGRICKQYRIDHAFD